MFQRHLIVSSSVSAILIGLFAFFIYNNNHFKLTEEYQVIPDGFVLPKGCDIRIDMKTGETYAKLRKIQDTKDNMNDNIIAVPVDTTDKRNNSDYPEYKNITKSRIQSRLTAEMQANLETALINLEDSWDFLVEEAAAMEFGLAILEAKNFGILRKFMGRGDEKALKIISISLQNNPLAVEKFVELEIHENELKLLIEREKLDRNVLKSVLRILESLKFHGKTDEKFYFVVLEQVKRHLEDHKDEDLKERFKEIIINA